MKRRKRTEHRIHCLASNCSCSARGLQTLPRCLSRHHGLHLFSVASDTVTAVRKLLHMLPLTSNSKDNERSQPGTSSRIF